MTITLHRPQSLADLRACVDLYLSLDEPGFMPASHDTCMKSIIGYWSNGAFIRIAKEDGALLGWMLGVNTNLEHISGSIVAQRYYASNCKGIKAFRVLKMLHEEMLVYAARVRATYCTSTGSHFDEKFAFSKMLEKCGWTRRGYLALFYMEEYYGRAKKT